MIPLLPTDLNSRHFMHNMQLNSKDGEFLFDVLALDVMMWQMCFGRDDHLCITDHHRQVQNDCLLVD